MSITLGIDGSPLLGQRSGVGYYTARLLAALLRQNPEWRYLLYSKRPLGSLEPAWPGVEQIGAYLPRSHAIWMQTVLPHHLRHQQPDLVHFTNAMAPLWYGRPYVLTIYDATLYLFRQHHPAIRHLSHALLPIVARRATAIITISQAARQDIVRVLKLPAHKVHVVYGATTPAFAPVTDRLLLADLKQRYSLPEKFLLYVGTIEPRKNLHRLVRAFYQLRQMGYRHKLLLAGPKGWLMQDFGAEIERLELQDAVHYLGYVPLGDLPGLLSLATLFVFPSIYEGFGLPPLEAMACGTPVLSSNTSALIEVLGDAAHLVDPQDEMAMATGMRQLLDDEDWRQELAARGLQRAARFSWSQAAQQTAAIYHQLLSAPAPISNSELGAS